jgi:hypothetical protein
MPVDCSNSSRADERIDVFLALGNNADFMVAFTGDSERKLGHSRGLAAPLLYTLAMCAMAFMLVAWVRRSPHVSAVVVQVFGNQPVIGPVVHRLFTDARRSTGD